MLSCMVVYYKKEESYCNNSINLIAIETSCDVSKVHTGGCLKDMLQSLWKSSQI